MVTKINKIDNLSSKDINSQLVEELLSKADPSELFWSRWVISAIKEADSGKSAGKRD